MAGAVLAPPFIVDHWDQLFQENYLIKNAEVINFGDLVGIDTSGFMVNASKTQGAIVRPKGVAVAIDVNSTRNTLTGDGSTVYCSIAKRAIIRGTAALPLDSTRIPAFAKALRVYLGPIGTTTVSNYTCTQTTTNGDALLAVGWVSADGTFIEIDVPNEGTIYQTAGNSTLSYS